MALGYIDALKTMITDATATMAISGAEIYVNSEDCAEEVSTVPGWVITLGDPISLGIFNFTGTIMAHYYDTFDEEKTDAENAQEIMDILVTASIKLQNLSKFAAGYLVNPRFEINEQVILDNEDRASDELRFRMGTITINFGVDE